MTQEKLTQLNLGASLDDIANIDPRGYGVCKILYAGAKEFQGGAPLAMNAACKLNETLSEGDLVYIITGFVLRPYKMAETDGIISSMILCRCLIKAYGVKPVLICQEENMPAVRGLAGVLGIHLYDTVEEMKDIPVSMAVKPFTKDIYAADEMANAILSEGEPKAAISIEAPGANSRGVYHNAIGLDTTELEAKTDVLWQKIVDRGILNIAIGDLGNEIGMGSIHEHLVKNIPYAGDDECQCGRGGGLAVTTKTDNIITATVSDWGCSAMMAAVAYLVSDIDVFPDAELQKRAMIKASECGMIDMYGWAIPAIDGFGVELNCALITMMRECVVNALSLKTTCKKWFDTTIKKGFFND